MKNLRHAVRCLETAAACALAAVVAASCASDGTLPFMGGDSTFDASMGSETGAVDGGRVVDSGMSPNFTPDSPTSTKTPEDGCVPVTCTSATVSYCGDIGDGCGGALSCGDCPNGGVCGGGGLSNVCELANCTKGSCAPANGAVYYGVIGDGCNGVIDCGSDCPDGGVVASDGGAGVCPGTGTGVCTGIQCNIATCPNGGSTTVSGTVYDPAAVNPIYNAIVYIANAPLDPVPTGASCDVCGATASGQPLTSALTDTAGHFTLTNVPTGSNIPLVIQVGKWRREVMIPTVTSCVDNPLTDPQVTRLPRTQSEGNIPHIAVTTGDADAIECLLRRIGIADSEFTTDSGNGRVHLYYGGDLTGPTGGGVGTNSFNGGATFSSAGTLWSSVPKMEGYDIMMMSCEGGQYADAKKPYLPNPEAYLNAGGRVFFGHLHSYWLREGSAALQSTANYIGVGSDLPDPVNGVINTSFPKGNALADWLVNVGATPTRGQLQIHQGQFSVTAVNPPTQAWVTVPDNVNDSDNRPSMQYLSFNTPVGEDAGSQCGRAVFTDLHMNVSVDTDAGETGGDNSDPTKPFPTECKSNGLTPQAKALEFMFFDLSACLQSDTAMPIPPPTPPGAPPPPAPPTIAPPPPK